MSSMATGRTCRQVERDHGKPVPVVDLSGVSSHANHQAGSGRPVATEDMRMSHRYYQTAHPYYAGVDLHARTLAVHVCDPAGTPRLECELPASPDAFLDAITPFRPGLVVGAECMFAWYWLADLCEREAIPFVLGHALARRHDTSHSRAGHIQSRLHRPGPGPVQCLGLR